MNIETVCNTPDDVLFAHIERNSKRFVPWVKSVEAHDGQAIIVGGGPSVIDWLDEIRYRKSQGQTVFALNDAAKFLNKHSIEVDHQVIVDARPRNASFLGYAKHYLLSSQCHPSLFDNAGSTTLWHQEYPDDMDRFDSCLPNEVPAHALIGGGTTVGLSAMVLAYVLGYRKLHLYGYDSSYRADETHAYGQEDPQRLDCVSTVAGKSFRTSLAMAKQAELFPQLADSLIDLGCLITLRGDGLLPWTSQQSAIEPEPMQEQDKYRKMWEQPIYRQVSPGEHVADTFVELSGIGRDDTCIDFGCGTGRGADRIVQLSSCDMTLVDFASNCLDKDQKLTERFRFFQADLTKPILLNAKYGFCADVMEHIPPEDVFPVLLNILTCVDKAFFQISLIDDACGKLIGQRLHLSVNSFDWWFEKLSSLGKMIFAEDHGESAVFYLETNV